MEIKNENSIISHPIRPWVYHTQWWTLMAGLGGSFVFFFTAFSQMNHKLDNHIQLAADMNKNQYERMDKHAERTDKLYEMFIELVKEKK